MIGEKFFQRGAQRFGTLLCGTWTRGEVVVGPEIATRTPHRQRLGHAAERFSDPCQKSERGGQAGLQIGLDRAREHRSGTFGPDGNGDGVAIDDGGCDKDAVVQIVNDIHQRALGAGERGGARVLTVILVSGIEQNRTGNIARLQRAPDQVETPFTGPVGDFIRGFGCENVDAGFGLEQQAQLGQCRLSAA